MEIYLLRREEWEKFYNCNLINVDDVPFVERYHPLNGTIIIGLFVIFEVNKYNSYLLEKTLN